MSQQIHISSSFDWAEDVEDAIASGDLSGGGAESCLSEPSSNEENSTSSSEGGDSDGSSITEDSSSSPSDEEDNQEKTQPRGRKANIHAWINDVGILASEEDFTCGNVAPSMIGMHVLNEDFNEGPRPKFARVSKSDLLLFKPTTIKEKIRLSRYGVRVTDALPPPAEVGRLLDEKLGRNMCKPSPLRRCWSIVY